MNAHMIESPLANVCELDQVLFRECFAEPAKWFQESRRGILGGLSPFFAPGLANQKPGTKAGLDREYALVCRNAPTLQKLTLPSVCSRTLAFWNFCCRPHDRCNDLRSHAWQASHHPPTSRYFAS